MSNLSRREFVGAAAAAAVASGAITSPLPLRAFGRTGERLPILAIGCGNRLWAAYVKEERGLEALNLAFDMGIRYFDTAQGYGNGVSETWVGKAHKGRRNEVILATKTGARKYDDVLARCEESLKRLQTDHLDVYHIHGLSYEAEVDELEKQGTVRALRRLRDEKVIRFMGVTSHTDPVALAKALERYDFDVTQMAVNAGLQGRSPDGAGYWKKGGNSDLFGEPVVAKPYPGESFQDVALPVAVRKNMGIIGMKTTGQESLIGGGPGKTSGEQLIRYALSLPVSMVSVGMPKLDFVRQNVALAKNFQPMPKSEMDTLSTRLAEANKLALDYHFHHEHQDS
jgi:aryl-alcohol dehydrogenase-like predicted oxidoreductase